MYSKVVFKSVGAGFHEHVLVGFSNINLVGCYYTTLMKGTNLASSASFWGLLLEFLLLFV